MFSFSGGSKAQMASGVWSKAAIVSVLEARYENVGHLGDDDGFSLYGINDNGLNFIVAMVEVHGAPDQVTEVGFLTRFVGFSLDQSAVEFINRNLHISVAGIEGGDLFLVGGVQAAGNFDPTAFSMVLEAWKRDVMVTLHAISGGASISAAFPAARLEKARSFAVNYAPKEMGPDSAGNGEGHDLLKSYFGDKPRQSLCGTCEGRGKRGLIARVCHDCDGVGFVKKAR